MKSRFLSLRIKLIIIGLVVTFLPIVFLGGLGIFKIKSILEIDFINSSTREIKQVDNAMDLYFKGIERDCEMLANNYIVRRADESIMVYSRGRMRNKIKENGSIKMSSLKNGIVEAEIYKEYYNYGEAHPNIAYVYLGTNYGGYIQWPQLKVTYPYDPRRRIWYRKAISNPDKIVRTKPYAASDIDMTIISTLTTVRDERGEVIGVQGIDISLKRLTDMVNNINIGKTGYLIITTNDGTILADPKNPEHNFKNIRELGIDKLRNIALLDNDNFKATINNKDYLINLYTSDDTGWKFIAITEEKELVEWVNSVVIDSLIIIILIGIIVVILSILVSNTFSKQIEKAVDFAESIADDPMVVDKVEVDREDELGELLDSLNFMSDELRASYQQMEAYNEEITAQNEEIERSYRKADKFASNLRYMVTILSGFSEAVFTDEKKFLSDLFYKAVEIIPEADYGSVYLYRDGKVDFIDAVGHDLVKLREIDIDQEIFQNEMKGINIIRNTVEDTVVDIDSSEEEVFKEASKSIKETMSFDLYDKEKHIAGISLDIGEDNDRGFSKESILIMKAFNNLASTFYTMQSYSNLQNKFKKEIIRSVTKILEFHDKYTRGHSQSVAQISEKIAKKMNLSEQEIRETYWAGMVHDIGKILVPKEILNKKGRLNDKEYELIKKHPVWAYDTLNNSEELKNIGKYVLYHHERWDGNGYPKGIKGDEIPIISQIIMTADSWDAMRSNRSYRKKLPKEVAIEEIRNSRGSQLPPKVVDIFLEMLEEGEI